MSHLIDVGDILGPNKQLIIPMDWHLLYKKYRRLTSSKVTNQQKHQVKLHQKFDGNHTRYLPVLSGILECRRPHHDVAAFLGLHDADEGLHVPPGVLARDLGEVERHFGSFLCLWILAKNWS